MEKPIKKLFAILLAVMLLMTAAASAETASTFTFLDPVLVIDTGAGAQTFDLTGLQVKIAATESDPVKNPPVHPGRRREPDRHHGAGFACR